MIRYYGKAETNNKAMQSSALWRKKTFKLSIFWVVKTENNKKVPNDIRLFILSAAILPFDEIVRT